MTTAEATAAAVPELRDIPGPGALGGGRRRFFNLLWLQATTEFKLNYYGTVLGYAWSLMRPLLLFSVLYLVFTKIFRIGSGVENYAALLLMNLMLFMFFSDATSTAVNSVVSNESLVRKMQYPRLVIPLSVVLTAVFNLGLNMVAVFVLIILAGVEPMWTWLLFPVILLPLVAVTTGLAMLLSSLYVRFRDVAQIWTVFSTMLLYASPVLYPTEIVEGDLRNLLLVNPLAPILEQARIWIIDPSAPSVIGAAGSAWGWIAPVAIGLGIIALGAWVFAREAPRIAEEL